MPGGVAPFAARSSKVKHSTSSNSPPLPQYDTVPEVAAMLRTTPKAIYTMVERGQIGGVTHFGRRLLFRRDALLQWLAERSGTPSPEGDRR
jgi:excisionase family DNA binding protein